MQQAAQIFKCDIISIPVVESNKTVFVIFDEWKSFLRVWVWINKEESLDVLSLARDYVNGHHSIAVRVGWSWFLPELCERTEQFVTSRITSLQKKLYWRGQCQCMQVSLSKAFSTVVVTSWPTRRHIVGPDIKTLSAGAHLKVVSRRISLIARRRSKLGLPGRTLTPQGELNYHSKKHKNINTLLNDIEMYGFFHYVVI